MPRKSNGFGNTKSFAVNGANKINHRTDKGRRRGAAGSYPSDRRYGSTVSRSVIEQYDMDSTWARWRRGMEYYYQAAYLEFQETTATLFQGTDFELPVVFDGYRFATKNADSRTHYAIHRSVPSNKQVCYIEEIQSDPAQFPNQFAAKEIWVKVIATRDIWSDDLLVRCQGERVTDGETAANIKYILTGDRKPAVYDGKSPKQGVSTSITVPLDEIRATEFIKENNGNLQSLVGQAVYIPNFYTNRPVTLFDQFNDGDDFFEVTVAEFLGGFEVYILENTGTLPPTLRETQNLDTIFETKNTSGGIGGAYYFRKSDYQRFYGQQYLTADVVREEVVDMSYIIPPFTIESISIDETYNVLRIESVPFQSQLKLYTPREQYRWLVFADNSFTIQTPDVDKDGNYKHAPGKPGDQLWETLKIGVDPWQDEIFTNTPLVISDLYTCSCPAYLRAIIRSPESYDPVEGKLNRQQRAPMPTARGATTYDGAGINKIAGIAESWANLEYKRGFKLCKHTIASMFINKIRVQEPNSFPSYESRLTFESKLKKDIAEVAEEFRSQLERSEITTVEIIYALAEALNLDDIELGFVLATSNF